MLEFGQKLKKKRESMGLTLEEVSRKTNVSLNYLQALECGNMSELPDVYMKMFLRTYAAFLHVSITPVPAIKKMSFILDDNDKNPQAEDGETVDFTIEDLPDENSSAITQAKRIISEEFEDFSSISISLQQDNSLENGEHPYKLFIAKYFKLIVFSIIAILTLITFLILKVVMVDEKKSEAESTTIKVITVESDQNNDLNINITDSVQSNVNSLNDSVSFTMAAVDSCYVLYYSDDGSVRERMLFPKQKMTVKAQYSMEIKVGNIQKLSYAFNGKPLVDQLKTDKVGSAFLKVSAGEGPYFIKKSDKIIKYLKDVYGIQSADPEKTEQSDTHR